MTAGEHLAQFYDTEDELVDAVVPYLAAGLDADDAVLVVATSKHRLAFERALSASGAGLEQAIAAGTYTAIDAAQVLSRLRGRAGDEISAAAFTKTIGELVRSQLASGRPLRVYGEIVGLMWEQDDAPGAIALEALWNGLQRRHPFTLLCGYPIIGERLEAASRVCCSHSLMLPTIGTDRFPPEDFGRLCADFTATIETPRRVRALLRSFLDDGKLGDDLTDRLTLAASELAANAVLHARTGFRLVVQLTRRSVWIGVEDGAPLSDRMEVVGRTPHGLGLIAAFALRWGVTPRPAGKMVWAELPR